MTDIPRSLVVPSHIHSYSRYAIGPTCRSLAALGGSLVGITPPVGVIYIPLYLPWPYNVRRVFWHNGNSGGRNDFGVYSIGGAKIFSVGATLNSGANQIQYVVPSPNVLLGPGSYFMAIATDGNVAEQLQGFVGTVPMFRIAGCYLQAGGGGVLPAAATFAAYSATSIMPICGLTNTDTGF